MPVSPAGNLPSTTSASAALAAGRSLSAGGQTVVARGGGVPSRGEATLTQPVGDQSVGPAVGSAQVDLSSPGRARASLADVRDAARGIQVPAADVASPRNSETLRADASRLVNAINNAVRVSTGETLFNGQDFLPGADRGSEPLPIRESPPPETNPEPLFAITAATSPTPSDVTDRPAAQQPAVESASDPAGPLPVREAEAPVATIERSRAETRRSANEEFNETQALNRIGISIGRDGLVNFDTVRFDSEAGKNSAAVEQTLGRFGQRVEDSAARQLSAVEAPERSERITSPRGNDRAARMEEVQLAVQQRIEFQQQINQTNNPFLVGGIAAYRGVFAL